MSENNFARTYQRIELIVKLLEARRHRERFTERWFKNLARFLGGAA